MSEVLQSRNEEHEGGLGVKEIDEIQEEDAKRGEKISRLQLRKRG